MKTLLKLGVCFFMLAVSSFVTSISAQDTLAVPWTLEERYEAFLKYLSPEKVYLHTDKDVYSIGDTIWFRGYVMNASVLSEYPESRFLYVELVGNTVGKDMNSNRMKEMPYVIQRIKVKSRGGVLEGYIPVSDDANTGYATVRAFTYWNLNKEPEYVFKKEISIINPVKDEYLKELENKKMRDDSQYIYLGAQNPFNPIKKVSKIDCAFLPEGGRLLAGTRNRIGVKVIDESGLGLQAEGKVFDHNNVQVASFSADQYGFADFYLSPNDENERYYAQVEDFRGTTVKVKLPAVEKDGVTLSLSMNKDMVAASVGVRGNVSWDGLRFVLCSSGEIYFEQPLKNATKLNLPVSGMPEGVNNAVVCSSSGQVYAKRPFFVMPEKIPDVTLETDRPDFGKRENIGILLNVGAKEGGSYSVSVTDDVLSPCSSLNDNIISYYFLSSEIRGNVEEPLRFFSDTIPLEKRIADLDLMLMTQGWEYYDLPSIFSGNYPMPKFGREYIQSISGQVNRTLFGKAKKSVVAFLAPSINFAAVGQLDEGGFFELKDIDFPDGTTFIVNASRNFNSTRHLRPVIFEDSFAPLTGFVHRKEKVRYSPKVSEILTSNYYNAGGDLSYQLNSITVYGRKKSLKGISPLPGYEFREDQIREGKRLEPYKSYDLFSYILETCPGLRMENRGGHRLIVCRVPAQASSFGVSSDWVPIVIYLDGFVVQPTDLWQVESLMVEDVESVVYLRGLDAAPFEAAAGSVSDYGTASNRSAVLIKTKRYEKSLWHISSGKPLGWQIPKRFYSPRYEVEGKDITPQGHDMRSTIYWNPSLSADVKGNIRFRFNSSDLLSGYTVTVEGVSKEGEPVSKRFKIR